MICLLTVCSALAEHHDNDFAPKYSRANRLPKSDPKTVYNIVSSAINIVDFHKYPTLNSFIGCRIYKRGRLFQRLPGLGREGQQRKNVEHPWPNVQADSDLDKTLFTAAVTVLSPSI
jgi:hypothetical protein